MNQSKKERFAGISKDYLIIGVSQGGISDYY